MSWKETFEGIQSITETLLLNPMDGVRALELENWTAANTANWLFMIIGSVAFVYWMLQLKKFNDNNEEQREIVSHSFLGEDVQ